MFPFPNRDASVHRDWPADVRYVAAKDGARIAEKGELGVALGNDRPLAFIRVQILVKTTVNDKRQKARIPATKLQWLPARHAILTSGSGRTLDGRESLRAGRDAQLLPCRPANRYPGPNAHTGPDGRTSVNQPLAGWTGVIWISGNTTHESSTALHIAQCRLKSVGFKASSKT